LAAFFGKGRKGGKVAIHWTTCGNVSKKRGAPAGQVSLKKFETLMAEPIDPSTHFGGE
jgi:predicted ribosome quality control (RQC) complex YloA/Tae2 family protein